MKELSIEEKAKAYDEAVERARIWKDKSGMPKDKQGILDDIFPELKESEDDRIRKWLIELVEEVRKANPTNVEHNGMCSEALAWIEKQAEHANFRSKIQIGDKVTRNKDGVLVNLSQLNRVAKVDEKQGEQNPNYNNKELKDVVIAELSKYNSNDLNAPWATDSTGLQYPLYFANLGAKWQEEQKPAWSEEDDNILATIIEEGYLKPSERQWLKSLKDRVFPKPKQEWSEEDKTIIDSLLDVLYRIKKGKDPQATTRLIEQHINFIKSLKERYAWKPSDEQMEALANALSLAKNCGEESAFELRTLYEQLKKLREE